MLGGDTGWTSLGLSANWATDTAAPSYRVLGDRVWLKGSATNNNIGTNSAPFSVFPTAIRPPAASYVPVVYLTSGLIYLSVNPNGTTTLSSSVAAAGSIAN